MFQRLCRLGLVPGGCLLVACAAPGPADLPVGVLALMEGPFADASGMPTMQGAHMALELDSTRGQVTLDGRRYQVRLVVREHGDRPDAATTAARALITQDSVVAIVGPQLSRHAIPAAIIAENAQVPLISPMSSAPATTAGRHWVFRLAYLDAVQGMVLAAFARGDLGATRAAVLYDASSDYSAGVASLFATEFARRGGRVVAEERFTGDVQPTADQWRRIRAARPDVLLLPNFPAHVQHQLRALRGAGITATLLAGDSWDLQVLQTWPEADGSYLAHQWTPGVPLLTTRALASAFQERYGAPPRTTAAMTFDAVGILLDALRRAGTADPVAVRDAISATRDYRGATGTITFAGRPDPARSVVISTVRDRTVQLVRLVDP